MADLLESNYLYTLDEKRNVDADRIGSLMRFANNSFSHMANCRAMIIQTSKGEPRIVLFAARNIQNGEELFFDYGYSAMKQTQLSWMGYFKKKYFPDQVIGIKATPATRPT